MNYRFTPAKDKTTAIVFLHGWGGSVDSFAFFEYCLCREYTTLNVDFPGFGKSMEPKIPYSVDNYVSVIHDLIVSLGIKKVIFVCHSFGGRVAVKYNNRYKESVLGNVFIDIAGIKPRFNFYVYLKKRRYKFLKWLVKIKLVNSKKLDDYGSSDYKVLSPIMKSSFNNIIGEDLSKYLTSICAKTLIIWGRKDKDTPMYMAKKIHKRVKGSKLVIINGGHFAYIDLKYKAIGLISSFLGEVYE